MRRLPATRVLLICAGALALGCAGAGPDAAATSGAQLQRARSSALAKPGSVRAEARSQARRRAARVAMAQIGTPYRYGGASPAGFDCSGLVVYSYAAAGVANLPRTAADLEAAARPVALRELAPGDLLFFRLSGKKTSHVALYVGERSFVHAPSSGGRVERVDFDHVYWGPRLARAGRL